MTSRVTPAQQRAVALRTRAPVDDEFTTYSGIRAEVPVAGAHLRKGERDNFCVARRQPRTEHEIDPDRDDLAGSRIEHERGERATRSLEVIAPGEKIGEAHLVDIRGERAIECVNLFEHPVGQGR